MAYVWASLILALMLGTQILHIFSLPANWLLVGLAAIWKLTGPASELTWTFIGVMLALAAVGELAEFASQAWGAKKYGASAKGNLGGIIGAIVGAILGAPFFLGLGALVGALAGAFGGCYFFERMQGRGGSDSGKAAMGAFWGKAFGMAVKMSLGAAMFIMCADRVWP